MVVRWDVVLTTLEYMKKAFGYIALMFIIIFWGFIFSNHFIYSVKGQYFENYLPFIQMRTICYFKKRCLCGRLISF